MRAVQTIWNFLWLFSVLAFAQLFGFLLFLRLKRHAHFLAHFLGFVAPVLLSLLFLWMILIYRYYQAHPLVPCGGQLFAASLVMLLSGGLQLVFGAIAQIALHSRVDGCAKTGQVP